ncbi:hypothetical protein M0811_02666 [Anaeramoeba ignava]|uniref:Uncharacterized protein n=1 Tax=Anaeramoeba ignava TaxID=1746090 RepID=A0A9Q0LBV2_ANAIG|nr:hypothetical protein M0811_02666 [Anaeramoeba ignava]
MLKGIHKYWLRMAKTRTMIILRNLVFQASNPDDTNVIFVRELCEYYFKEVFSPNFDSWLKSLPNNEDPKSVILLTYSPPFEKGFDKYFKKDTSDIVKLTSFGTSLDFEQKLLSISNTHLKKSKFTLVIQIEAAAQKFVMEQFRHTKHIIERNFRLENQKEYKALIVFMVHIPTNDKLNNFKICFENKWEIFHLDDLDPPHNFDISYYFHPKRTLIDIVNDLSKQLVPINENDDKKQKKRHRKSNTNQDNKMDFFSQILRASFMDISVAYSNFNQQIQHFNTISQNPKLRNLIYSKLKTLVETAPSQNTLYHWKLAIENLEKETKSIGETFESSSSLCFRQISSQLSQITNVLLRQLDQFNNTESYLNPIYESIWITICEKFNPSHTIPTILRTSIQSCKFPFSFYILSLFKSFSEDPLLDMKFKEFSKQKDPEVYSMWINDFLSDLVLLNFSDSQFKIFSETNLQNFEFISSKRNKEEDSEITFRNLYDYYSENSGNLSKMIVLFENWNLRKIDTISLTDKFITQLLSLIEKKLNKIINDPKSNKFQNWIINFRKTEETIKEVLKNYPESEQIYQFINLQLLSFTAEYFYLPYKNQIKSKKDFFQNIQRFKEEIMNKDQKFEFFMLNLKSYASYISKQPFYEILREFSTRKNIFLEMKIDFSSGKSTKKSTKKSNKQTQIVKCTKKSRYILFKDVEKARTCPICKSTIKKNKSHFISLKNEEIKDLKEKNNTFINQFNIFLHNYMKIIINYFTISRKDSIENQSNWSEFVDFLLLLLSKEEEGNVFEDLKFISIKEILLNSFLFNTFENPNLFKDVQNKFKPNFHQSLFPNILYFYHEVLSTNNKYQNKKELEVNSLITFSKEAISKFSDIKKMVEISHFISQFPENFLEKAYSVIEQSQIMKSWIIFSFLQIYKKIGINYLLQVLKKNKEQNKLLIDTFSDKNETLFNEKHFTLQQKIFLISFIDRPNEITKSTIEKKDQKDLETINKINSKIITNYLQVIVDNKTDFPNKEVSKLIKSNSSIENLFKILQKQLLLDNNFGSKTQKIMIIQILEYVYLKKWEPFYSILLLSDSIQKKGTKSKLGNILNKNEFWPGIESSIHQEMIGEITKFQISHAYTIRELNPISLCLCRIILFSCLLTRLITSNSSIVSLFIPENKLKNINLDDEKIHFKEIIQNRIDEEFEIISTQLNISKEYAIYYVRLFFYRLKMENEERKLDFDFMKKQKGKERQRQKEIQKENRDNFEKIISILQNEYHSKIMNTLKEIKEKENKILESLIPLEVLPNKLDLSFDNTSNQFNDFRNQTQFPLVKIYLNHQEEFSIFTSFPGFLFFSNQIISLNINKDKPIGFHYLYQSLKIQPNINSDILSKSFEDFQVIWNYISNKISKRFFTNSFTDVIFPEITEEKVDIGKQKDVINFIYGIIKYIVRFNNTIIDEIFQEKKEEIQFNDILLNFPLPEDLSKNIENISSVFHLDYSEIYFFISKNKINLSNVEIFEKFLESKISSFSSTLTKIDADSLDPSLDPFQKINKY